MKRRKWLIWLFGIIGLILQPMLMDIGGGSWIGWIGILFSIISLWLYATAKGRHEAWSLFGLFPVLGAPIGVIVIWCLKDYSSTTPEARIRKLLIWLFGIIGIYLSLFWFDLGGIKYLGLVGTILLIISLWLYATAKGRHEAWSLFGLLSIPGFIIGVVVIWCLKDYSSTTPERRIQRSVT